MVAPPGLHSGLVGWLVGWLVVVGGGSTLEIKTPQAGQAFEFSRISPSQALGIQHSEHANIHVSSGSSSGSIRGDKHRGDTGGSVSKQHLVSSAMDSS